MDQDVIRRRNAVFLIIYRRVTSYYPQYVPKAVRWTLEVAFLLMAVATLSFWSYVHFTYIVEPEDCLMDVKERPFPSDGILQVEVYTNSTELWRKAQSSLFEKYSSTPYSLVPMNSTSEIDEDEDTVFSGSKLHEWINWILPKKAHDLKDEFISNQQSLYELLDIYTLKLYSVDYTILEFSQEPGYLSLTLSARTRLNITTRRIYINPGNVTCFGGRFGQFITKYLLGYDMMVIASFKNLLPAVHGSGYVKNLLTGSHYYYRVQWMGKWRYVAGILPALFFTLVASVLLRQIHYHVFKFLTHFHHLLNEGIPMPIQTGAQVPFLIVTYAAIGLVIVMSEALGDDSLFSLMMVATVWEADQFYAVFCRHKLSKIFFPMFFFLYHVIPYGYFIRFNGQFWFLPFIFHWLLIQNAVLFFFHHYELNERRIALMADVHRPIHQQHRIHVQPVLQQPNADEHRIQEQQQLQLEQRSQAHQSPSEERTELQRVQLSQHGEDLLATNSQTIQSGSEDVERAQECAGTPIEESLTEDIRSALIIRTQNDMSPPRHSILLDVQESVSDPGLNVGSLVQSNSGGLRERRLIQGHEL